MSQTSRIYLVGKTPEAAARLAIERDAKNTKRRRNEPWRMNAYQRRSELQRLAQYRHAQGIAMGNDAGWANAVGNMLRVLNGNLTVKMLTDEWGAYGVPALSPEIVADAVKHLAGKTWGPPTLFAPVHAGSMLELTSAERAESGVTKIDACDEPRDERKKRLDKERKAARRAAEAALAPRVETKKQMAQRLGISRTELYNRLKSGEKL